jgi:hypothetical protein
MVGFMVCAPRQILLVWSNKGGLGGRGMWLVWYRIWWGKSEGKRRLEARHWWENNIKMCVHDRYRWRALVSAVMNLGFHKMRGISWLAVEILVSEERPCSMEFIWLVCTPVQENGRQLYKTRHVLKCPNVLDITLKRHCPVTVTTTASLDLLPFYTPLYVTCRI